MKIYLFINLVLLLPLFVNGQANQVKNFDRLRGEQVDYFIQIKPQNSTLKYRNGKELEDKGNYLTLSPLETRPTIFKARKPAMNIKMDFINPLTYSVKIIQEGREDPLYRTTIGFFESVTKLISIAAGGLEGESSTATIDSNDPAIANLIKSNTTNGANTNNDVNKKEEIMISSGIANWLLWYSYQKTRIAPSSLQRPAAGGAAAVGAAAAGAAAGAAAAGAPPAAVGAAAAGAAAGAAGAPPAAIVAAPIADLNNPKPCIDEVIVGASNLFVTVVDIEEYVHGRFTLADDANSKDKDKFINYIGVALNGLKNASNHEDLAKERNKSDSIYKKLRLKQDNTDKLLTKISGYISQFSSVPVGDAEGFCAQFKIYTKAQLTDYINDVQAILKKRAQVLTQLNNLSTEVDNYLKQDGNREVRIEIGQVTDVGIQVIQREVVFTDQSISFSDTKDILKGYCTIVETSAAIVEVSPGLFFPSDLTYSEYNADLTANNNYVVVDRGRKQTYVGAALFLNWVFNVKISPGVFPMLQLGIGTGNLRPTILTGLGLRIYKQLSISFGYISKFDKVLDGISVGSQIDNPGNLAKFEKYKLSTSGFYLGFQYKL